MKGGLGGWQGVRWGASRRPMESQGRDWAALGPLCWALEPRKWEWRISHRGATAFIPMLPFHINHYNKLTHFDCCLGMLKIIYVCRHRNLLHQFKMMSALRLSWLWETGRERIGSRRDGAATGGELSHYFLLDELSPTIFF